MKKFSTATKITFVLLFAALVFASTKINLAQLVGKENQFFTLFQLFGPAVGGILGSFLGAAVVLLATAANFSVDLIRGTAEFELVTILRLLPMVFAAYYFGTRKRSASIAIPLIAIALFVLHPVGRQVWYYSLFWTIPVIAVFFRRRLFLRSLGSTFAAHSVGGALWIWTVPTAPALWIALIPVVIIERILFASGISLSYVFANTVLQKVQARVPFMDRFYSLSNFVRSSPDGERYLISKRIFRYF